SELQQELKMSQSEWKACPSPRMVVCILCQLQVKDFSQTQNRSQEDEGRARLCQGFTTFSPQSYSFQ
ncbi:hypothetical protein GBF38_014634, partial [Nibea albiflora]